MSQKNPKISVVILNWNGKKFLEQFLPNVLTTSYKNFELIIIDNGSSDESVPFLKDFYPSIRLIELPKNLGFAGGYNEGLKQIDTDYYVLLNSDVEITSDWLQPMLKRIEENKKIVALQPKILAYHKKSHFEYAGASGGFIDKLGYPFCRGRIFNSLEEDKGQYQEAIPIFWATGCALFIDAKKYWEVGGLDTDLFAHQEEIDLCWRLQNKGYQIWIEPQSIVYHVGGGTLNQGSPGKDYLNFRNNLIIILKNHPKPFSTLIIRLLLDALAFIRMCTQLKIANAWAIVRAYKDFILSIKTTLTKRKKNPIPSSYLKCIYTKSIVHKFFLMRIKTFKDL